MLEYYSDTSIEYVSTPSIISYIFRFWIFCFLILYLCAPMLSLLQKKPPKHWNTITLIPLNPNASLSSNDTMQRQLFSKDKMLHDIIKSDEFKKAIKNRRNYRGRSRLHCTILWCWNRLGGTQKTGARKKDYNRCCFCLLLPSKNSKMWKQKGWCLDDILWRASSTFCIDVKPTFLYIQHKRELVQEQIIEFPVLQRATSC